MKTPTAKAILERAVYLTFSHHPFFASLALQLPRREDRTIPTMCTDGREIRYNPDFVEKELHPNGLALSGLIHEISHCAFGHIFRRGPRDPFRFNCACDFALHAMFEEWNQSAPSQGKLPIGKGWLHDPKYKGLSAEDIYAKLPEPKKSSGGGDGDGKSGPGEFEDAPGSASEREALAEEWKVRVLEAAHAAQQAGKLPAGLAHLVAMATKAKVDWKSILRRFVSATAKDDYNWSRPNRRFLHSGLYLPGLHSQRIGTVAVARDTSGSTCGQWGQFTREVQSILDELCPSKLIMFDCDAAAVRFDYEPGDIIRSEIIGGGGTSFVPVFNELHGEEPVCLVYLTDLYGTFPDCPPSYPVLWITPNEQVAPFGETVRMED